MSSHSGHDHGAHLTPRNFSSAFIVGIILNLSFVIAEAVWGYFAHSLALMADAGHNLSDVVGLALAWGALIASKKPPTKRFTYGFKSTSILAALFNALLLLVAIGAVVWEAIGRLGSPQPVEATTVMWVAALGIVINAGTAFMFMAGRKGDLNIRGAFLHMAADALVSAGVVLSGFFILKTGLPWIDPVVSLLVSLFIIWSTWKLLKDSVVMALHAVPESVDLTQVEKFLMKDATIKQVHDLHIWGMSTTETALTAHLVIPSGHPGDQFLHKLCHDLSHEFEIHHATIQIETNFTDHGCEKENHD